MFTVIWCPTPEVAVRAQQYAFDKGYAWSYGNEKRVSNEQVCRYLILYTETDGRLCLSFSCGEEDSRRVSKAANISEVIQTMNQRRKNWFAPLCEDNYTVINGETLTIASDLPEDI